jgi:hypothetical protein
LCPYCLFRGRGILFFLTKTFQPLSGHVWSGAQATPEVEKNTSPWLRFKH